MYKKAKPVGVGIQLRFKRIAIRNRMGYIIPQKYTVNKKEYLKQFIEACLQNNDRECDRLQVVCTVKYVLKSIQECWCSVKNR